MEKVLIAVDGSKGARATIPAFQHLIRKPRTVVLVTVQRLMGDSLVIDMMGDAEMQTLRESLKDTEHKAVLDRRAQFLLARYAWELRSEGVSVREVIRDGPPAEEILQVAREAPRPTPCCATPCRRTRCGSTQAWARAWDSGPATTCSCATRTAC